MACDLKRRVRSCFAPRNTTDFSAGVVSPPMIHQAVNRRSVFVDAGVARAQFASLKRELRRQLLMAFRTKKVSKAALSREFRTSRNAIYRLLGDTEESSNLRSLARVVRALDARITIKLAPRMRRTPNSPG